MKSMIPRLDQKTVLPKFLLQFLQQLPQNNFQGDISYTESNNLVNAVDNSIYQVLPQATLYPKNKEDLKCIFKLAQQSIFQEIQFVAKGGGTGTNGQSLNTGVVIDVSRYMNQILDINLQEKFVSVQPGVVLDELNEQLKPKGFFFAPDLSPSNRATLGGMVSTDACGKGSRIYGKTSDHILELSLVLENGIIFDSFPLNKKQLVDIKSKKNRIGEIHRVIDEILTEKKETIQHQFPKLSRFLTGYNLAKVSETKKEFNLNYIISGSEGTLAMISEMKLKLTPIPKYKQLVVVQYKKFQDALSDAKILVEQNPLAIETIDHKILNLAKQDPIWFKIGHLFEKNIDTIQAINLVEFVTNDHEQLKNIVTNFTTTLENSTQSMCIGYYVTKNEQEIISFWNLRKKGVGLLGNTKGNRRPIPFVEDTVVPPEHLANYISEFRALLDSFGLEYGMFGHVDVGCLHVRPALDLKDLHDQTLIRTLSDQVVSLVKKYGGIIWGEHGKGFRSEYVPQFFGTELYQDLQKVKEVFDPKNRLNPGKIATPFSMKDQIPKLDSIPLRGNFDRQIPQEVQQEYHQAIYCNGNGLCLNYQPNDVMCPSSKVTRDRIHSPKGRATLLREWLRRLAEKKYDVVNSQIKSSLFKKAWITHMLQLQKVWNTWNKSNQYDFSHEVYEAMLGCLSCKACATQCPIQVDIPSMKARFLDMYYTRYLHPTRDYMIGFIETIAKLTAPIAPIINWQQNTKWFQNILYENIHMVDPPKLSWPTCTQKLKQASIPILDIQQLENLSKKEKEYSVILLQDAFTSFYNANVVIDTAKLLKKLGYQVFVTPFISNGKPLHIKGFLNSFKRTVKKNVEYLTSIAEYNIPIIGFDPSIILTYKDEYPEILKINTLPFKIYFLQEWLILEIEKEKIKPYFSKKSSFNHEYHLMSHCTERTAEEKSELNWQTIFTFFNLKLNIKNIGCCGMCGTYGHEKEHYLESKGIFEMSWKPQIEGIINAQETILTTGYSCRSQIKRFAHFESKHPAQLLLEAVHFDIANIE